MQKDWTHAKNYKKMLGSLDVRLILLACSDGCAALRRARSGAFEYKKRLQTHANNYLKISAQPCEQPKLMCVPASCVSYGVLVGPACLPVSAEMRDFR